MGNKSKISGLFWVYILGFIFAFHTALPTYINSNFINLYVPNRFVGIIYTLAYLLAIICLFSMPFFLRRFGNYKTTLFFVALDFIALLGLTFIASPFWIIFSFILELITVSLVYFSTDIFLEGYSSNKQTGVIRGIYLTSVNLAWALSPFITGLILTNNNDYWRIYLTSFVLLVPVFLILVANLRKFKDSVYEVTPIWQTAKKILADKDVFNILSADFLLYFFYSWMIIYTPIYLYKDIGFNWSEIGIAFSVMLLPFVLLQFPLGRLADKRWGEKEILSLGFIIIAISTALISFISGKNILVWMILLFMTRVGASMVEVMCDTYFFKKVDSQNANVISFYRMAGSLAYILGPLAATVMFSFSAFDIKYLFLVLGLIMLFGLKFSLSLRDTN